MQIATFGGLNVTDREKAGEPVVPVDHVTTVAELRAVVRRFVAERDWQQFHAPKNLAMAMAHGHSTMASKLMLACKDSKSIELR